MRRATGPGVGKGGGNLREQRFRVLVVDDAEGIRIYLANLLELKGYDVDTVEDGRRALALIEGGAAPDVIILDVMMPGLDGIETLRRIRDLASPVANVHAAEARETVDHLPAVCVVEIDVLRLDDGLLGAVLQLIGGAKAVQVELAVGFEDGLGFTLADRSRHADSPLGDPRDLAAGSSTAVEYASGRGLSPKNGPTGGC